jgi:hypothetical protein
MWYLRSAMLIVAVAARLADAQYAPTHFVPAVEFRDSVANCVQPTTLLHPGDRAFSLHFGTVDSAQRVVTGVWGSDGKLRSYSDARGDLRPPFPPDAQRNPRTTIKIDVLRHVALMYNDVDGEQQGSAASDAEGAMDSENLGPPRQMLDRLRRQCGAP